MPKHAAKTKLRADADRFAVGMATRRAVLGDRYVAGREKAKSRFDADFQAFITETAWGGLWSRPGLSRRDRSLITIALLAALGHDEELALHVDATRNTGATMDEVKEALLHVAVYGGVPAANSAFRIAKRAFAEMGAKTGRKA